MFSVFTIHDLSVLLIVMKADGFIDDDAVNSVAGNDPIRNLHSADNTSKASVDSIKIGLWL